jgi:hypothetical protein
MNARLKNFFAGRRNCETCANTVSIPCPAKCCPRWLLTHESMYINETLARINPFCSHANEVNDEASIVSDVEVKETAMRTARD